MQEQRGLRQREFRFFQLVLIGAYRVVPRLTKIRLLQIRIGEAGTKKIRTAEIHFAEIRIGKIRLARAASPQNGFAEIHAHKSGIIQDGILKIRVGDGCCVSPINPHHFAMPEGNILQCSGIHFQIAQIAILKGAIRKLATLEQRFAKIAFSEIAQFELLLLHARALLENGFEA